MGWKGLFFDRLMANALGSQLTPSGVGLYRARNRTYSPTLGRWLQRDPNATAQPVLEAALFNGLAFSDFALSMDAPTLYGDGMNLFQFGRSNPIANGDAMGLFTYAGVAASGAVYGALIGGTLGWMRSYAHGGDGWQQAGGAAAGMVGGAIGGAAFGLLGGAISRAAGAGIEFGMGVVGIMFGPMFVGVAAKEEMDAETYADRVMAHIDLGLSVLSLFTAHTMAFEAQGNIVWSTALGPRLDTLKFSPGAIRGMSRDETIHITRSMVEAVFEANNRVPDPQGTPHTFMYSATVWRNGKEYVLEVLWNAPTNTVWHVMLR